MSKVYLALGSNVGERLSNLRNAANLLAEHISNMKVSLVYETRPMGYLMQSNFLNAAITGDTVLAPDELLKFTKSVENKIGKVNRFKWGPREIDIDLLLYDDLICRGEMVEVPHPRIQERDFVLRPLMDLDPELMHPLYKKTVRQLYEQLPKTKLHIMGEGKDLLKTETSSKFK